MRTQLLCIPNQQLAARLRLLLVLVLFLLRDHELLPRATLEVHAPRVHDLAFHLRGPTMVVERRDQQPMTGLDDVEINAVLLELCHLLDLGAEIERTNPQSFSILRLSDSSFCF